MSIGGDEMVKVILGAQWGDEGKGKMVDLLAQAADIVVRYQGGSNAGHTIVNKYGNFDLHLIPSGIFNPATKCIIGTGVVIHPDDFIKEMEQLYKVGITANQLKQQIMISERAHLVMPYHVVLDKLEEEKRKKKIGTTLKGIGPAYVDKVGRSGIQIGELLHLDILKDRLEEILLEKNDYITKIYGGDPLRFEDIWGKLQVYQEQLAQYIQNTQKMMIEAIGEGKEIIAEGQLGVMRDLDWGAYPFVTSSNPISSSVGVGAGIPPQQIDEVIGVCKAYTSTVGEGYFLTHLDNEIGRFFCEKGAEIGVTTGRARKCGWLDLPAVKYGAEINGYTSLALTKVDVLSSLSEINVCIAYRHKKTREILNEVRPYFEMDQWEPIYETLPGWDEDISEMTSYVHLPKNTQSYIHRIEQYLEVPIRYISVGPHREQTIIKE